MAPSPSIHRQYHDSSPSTSSSKQEADTQSTQASHQGQPLKELELQRKRARDRKSQQAMRDRNKWTIRTLTDQVAFLSGTLDQKARDVAALEAQIRHLKGENTQLRTQNAAFHLSMVAQKGNDGDASSSRASHNPSGSGSLPSPPWKLYPKNTPPGCLTDQIVQGFVDRIRAAGGLMLSSRREKTNAFLLKPNLCSLLEETHRPEYDISNVVTDILGTHPEIEGLPRQVAAFYLMSTYLKVR